MVTIKLHDYYEPETDTFHIVGSGRNSAEVINRQIMKAVASKQDIVFDINSGGGYVTEGNAIYNCLLNARKTVNVTTLNSGLAASIASIIFMAGSKRVMLMASLMMIHSPGIDLYNRGTLTSEQLRAEADTLDSMQEVLVSIYSSGTKLSESTAKRLVDAETWLSADKCMTFGLATEVDKSHLTVDATGRMVAMIRKQAPTEIRLHTNKFFNTIKIKKTMATNQKSVISNAMKTAKLFTAAITAAFGNQKNEILTDEDGSEFFTDGAIEVGVTVYEDEEHTIPFGSDTITAANGDEITIEDGVITEIKPFEDTEEGGDDAATDALKAEVKALKASNAALSSAVNSLTKTMESALQKQSNYKPKGTNRVNTSTSRSKTEEKKFDFNRETRISRRNGVPGRK